MALVKAYRQGEAPLVLSNFSDLLSPYRLDNVENVTRAYPVARDCLLVDANFENGLAGYLLCVDVGVSGNGVDDTLDLGGRFFEFF